MRSVNHQIYDKAPACIHKNIIKVIDLFFFFCLFWIILFVNFKINLLIHDSTMSTLQSLILVNE